MKNLERVFTGGNHLASSLIAAKCFPAEQKSYEQVLEDFGQPCADMWICWKAIMDARAQCSKSLNIVDVMHFVTTRLAHSQRLGWIEDAAYFSRILHFLQTYANSIVSGLTKEQEIKDEIAFLARTGPVEE